MCETGSQALGFDEIRPASMARKADLDMLPSLLGTEIVLSVLVF